MFQWQRNRVDLAGEFPAALSGGQHTAACQLDARDVADLGFAIARQRDSHVPCLGQVDRSHLAGGVDCQQGIDAVLFADHREIDTATELVDGHVDDLHARGVGAQGTAHQLVDAVDSLFGCLGRSGVTGVDGNHRSVAGVRDQQDSLFGETHAANPLEFQSLGLDVLEVMIGTRFLGGGR